MQTTLDEQLLRVEANADALWVASAKDAVYEAASLHDKLTTDQVWEQLHQHSPREPRAMGVVMRWAVKERIVETTGEYRSSRRPQCNGRPVSVYRSLIVGA